MVIATRQWFAASLASVCIGVAGCASAAEKNGSPGSAAVSTQNGENPEARQKSIDLARDELARELQIDASAIKLISAQPQTWSDSSLGCGRPGTMAAQVITPGYAVLFDTPKGNYRVHGTPTHAVVCNQATQWRNPRGVGLPLKQLEPWIERARNDLAAKLSAPQAQIRTLNFVATEWQDSSMGCAVSGETVAQQPTKGYRIALRYKGRVYTYHTDLVRVRPCPEIAVE